MITLEASPVGTEALDGTACPPVLARTLLKDIGRSNALFGGRAAVIWGVRRLLDGIRPDSRLTLLDVGAGAGDIARAARRDARRRGIDLIAVGLDPLREAAQLCREAGVLPLRASAAALPLGDGAFDIVIASQFLHHFTRASALTLVRAFDAVARLGVVVAEPRRTEAAAAGFWLASLALGFHRVTREDGVISVRRSFRPEELRQLLVEAGVAAVVRRRPGFRVAAYWRVQRADR
jgi:2-polyprenyl-3-methyl-5-hydroxy-6-metoxy-1,4-benzoquinol methylase